MNEYYAELLAPRKNASKWTVPIDKIDKLKIQGVRTIKNANFLDGNTHKTFQLRMV